jgi:hypothetical protein
MMEALNSLETSVLARGTRRNIPEAAILPKIAVVAFPNVVLFGKHFRTSVASHK